MDELEVWSRTSSAGAFAVLLGLLWGSFANVCIYRWPAGKSVVKPGSHCSSCNQPIAWYDNVPILSYLWLRGRCRACKTAFSPRYLLVEAVTGALFGVAWWYTLGTGGALFAPFQTNLLQFVTSAAFVFVMVVITFIDLDTKLILNLVTVPAAVVFYALSLALHHPWWQGLVGAAIGYGVPWAIGETYYRITGREGLGLGDSTLLAVVGALLGWRGVVVSLFGGSVLGSIIGITALLAARANAPAEPSDVPDHENSQPPTLMKTELPFGPFLAMAAVFYLFAAQWITVRFGL
ncbi:MAG TPA: prepilin peptidase [Kofleriaceae bacterium]|nr:prepilin peptidase [Kofleriaceae bacterium]